MVITDKFKGKGFREYAGWLENLRLVGRLAEFQEDGEADFFLLGFWPVFGETGNEGGNGVQAILQDEFLGGRPGGEVAGVLIECPAGFDVE